MTVVRAMAEEAQSASRGKKVEFESFLKKVIDAGEDILQKTPEMLPVLKKAGVVDAGGQGIMVIFVMTSSSSMHTTLSPLDSAKARILAALAPSYLLMRNWVQ